MNKKYRITQKILGALTLASGVVLAFDFISIYLVMLSGISGIFGIFGIFLLFSSVMTFISGSKIFNATTYDFLPAKIILSLIIIVSAFVAPLLLLNSGHNVIQFSIAIFIIIVLFIAPLILLRLTTKK